MKKILIPLMGLFLISACSELELGSHLVKQLSHPSNAQEEKIGAFKVGSPYTIKGRRYTPKERYQYTQTGIASWYGPGFHGKLTANGEIFDQYALTAAHKTLQLPSIVRVTNLNNGRSIIVRVNDRGPFAHDRIIDMSDKSAELLGMKHHGTARVRVDVMEKESRIVASNAKNGLSTIGTEIALNRGGTLNEMKIATPTSKPYTQVKVTRTYVQPPVKANNTSKMFDQMLVKQVTSPNSVRKPVFKNKVILSPVPSNIFVQAGSFTNEDSALTMKMALYNVSDTVNVYRTVNGSNILYKVKIGPVDTVEKADKILNILTKQGRDAKIVMANK